MASFETMNRSHNRRRFLTNTGMGLGVSALSSLLARQSFAASSGINAVPDAAKGLHFPPKAKRVIFLFMAGAPSQIDLFDYKPDLSKLFKTELPKSVSNGQRVTAMTKGKAQLIAPSKFGSSGNFVASLLRV